MSVSVGSIPGDFSCVYVFLFASYHVLSEPGTHRCSAFSAFDMDDFKKLYCYAYLKLYETEVTSVSCVCHDRQN